MHEFKNENMQKVSRFQKLVKNETFDIQTPNRYSLEEHFLKFKTI